MRIALASLIVLIASASSQIAPSSASSFPEYNLSNYRSWLCNNDANCLAKFPVYTSLTWAPLQGSAVWQSSYWRWTVNNNPSLFVKCSQDFFPYPPQYKLCLQYHPEYLGWTSPPNNPVFCTANSWSGACMEGQSVWSAQMNANILCCTNYGPAVAW